MIRLDLTKAERVVLVASQSLKPQYRISWGTQYGAITEAEYAEARDKLNAGRTLLVRSALTDRGHEVARLLRDGGHGIAALQTAAAHAGQLEIAR